MNKSNKIIELMPVGYYVIGVTNDNIYYEIPIIACVKYFNNKNNNEEIISTNYITLNNYGYNKCSRTSSNYSYIKHPDGLIYKTSKINDGINYAINVDEFKKKFVKNEIDENMYENNNIFLENVSNDIIERAVESDYEFDNYLNSSENKINNYLQPVSESSYEFDNYLNSSENEIDNYLNSSENAIHNFLQPTLESDDKSDEIDDYLNSSENESDNFLEQVLENSNENDNSSSETDISSSDRELLDYYY
jgi:hypothetical protein